MSIANEVKGKVVMLFSQTKADIFGYLIALNNTGVSAFIYAMPPLDGIEDFNQTFAVPIPFIAVDFEQGNQIVDYFINCKSKYAYNISPSPSFFLLPVFYRSLYDFLGPENKHYIKYSIEKEISK